MTADDRWTRIRTLFRAASEHDRSRWPAYLEHACPDDPSMRSEVLAMLEEAFASSGGAGDAFLAPPTALRAAPPADPLVDRQIGPYYVRRAVARGGMGIVYEALDTKLDKRVALKTLNPAFFREAAFRQRFALEARTLARLEDPHVVRVYALWEEGPYSFIVMEYVDGETLAEHIKTHGALAGPEVVALARQVLAALVKAHAQGIIHRDLKPGNLMLTEDDDGRRLVKVLDFGIAKLASAEGGSTLTQGPIGTLFYMAPELVRGLAQIDHRVDLYALGMTLYEALSGGLPFAVSDDEYTMRRRIVEGDFEPLVRRMPSVPRSLAKIVSTALEVEPEDRYQSAAAMLADLDTFDRTPPARRAAVRRAGAPPAQPAPARPTRTALTAGAITLLLVALAAVAVYVLDPSVARFVAEAPDSVQTTIPTPPTPAPPSSDEPAPLADADSPPQTDPSAARPVDPAASNPTPSDPADPHAPPPTTPNEPLPTASDSTTPDEPDPDEATSGETIPGEGTPEEGTPEEGTPEEPAVLPQEGTLALRLTPDATVFLDNTRQGNGISEQTYTLPAGSHGLRITHALFGMWSCDVTVDPGTTNNLSVDLTARARVTVVAYDEAGARYQRGAAIYIDGVFSDYTPKTLELTAGLHLIEVRLDGYETTAVVPESPRGCYQVRGDNINFDPNAIGGDDRIIARLRPTSNP